MIKIKTVLPLFQGFCGTNLDPSDFNIELAFDRELPEDCYEVDWNQVRIDLSKKFVSELQDYIDVKIYFVNLESPRDYCFVNDEIIAEVEFKDNEALIEFLKKVDHEKLKTFAKENFLPRSGFEPWLRYNANYVDWIKKLETHIDFPDDIDQNEMWAYLWCYTGWDFSSQDDFDEIREFIERQVMENVEFVISEHSQILKIPIDISDDFDIEIMLEMLLNSDAEMFERKFGEVFGDDTLKLNFCEELSQRRGESKYQIFINLHPEDACRILGITHYVLGELKPIFS